MGCIFSSVSPVYQMFAKVQVMPGLCGFLHKTLSDRRGWRPPRMEMSLWQSLRFRLLVSLFVGRLDAIDRTLSLDSRGHRPRTRHRPPYRKKMARRGEHPRTRLE